MRHLTKLLLLSALASISWLGVSAQTFKTLTKSELHEITYGWPITNPENTGHLDDVIKIRKVGETYKDEQNQEKTYTQDDQDNDIARAIALIREVYVNPNVPGIIHRGYDYQYNRGWTTNVVQSGVQWGDAYENLGFVNYQAVGEIGIKYSKRVQTKDYGWNIWTVNDIQKKDSYYYYFDRNEFSPNYEGYTLLFVEVSDDWKPVYKSINSYSELCDYFKSAIKSVRVVHNALRLNEGKDDAGTVFKIDTGGDKINRFFLMSKGQARLRFSQANGETGHPYPFLYSSRWYDREGTNSDGTISPFYHMFEQYSPTVSSDEGVVKDDLLSLLNSGESFNVKHDCLSVLTAGKDDAGNLTGHYFKMTGTNITEPQPVNDLLFLLPDRRLLYWYESNSVGRCTITHDQVRNKQYTTQQDYVDYHTNHQPKILKYSIILEGSATQVEGKEVYKIALDWSKNNFKDILGNKDQQFYLYRVTYDENGNRHIDRVKKLSDPVSDGVHSDDDLDKFLNKTQYEDYIQMQTSGQEVIYVVRGSDWPNDFLDLQFSNDASFLIPGTDKQERLVLGIGAVAHSKYDPKTHKNYYSNVIPMHNGVGTSVDKSFLKAGGQDASKFVFYRKTSAVAADKPEDVIATATLTSMANNTCTFNVEMQSQDNNGYTETKSTIKCAIAAKDYKDDLGYTIKKDEIDFAPFVIHDNFSVEPDNKHPNEYVYVVKFEAAKSFVEGSDVKIVYSNKKEIYVKHTDMKALNDFSKDNVDGDVQFDLNVVNGARYNIQVQGATSSDIVQYRSQRWSEPRDSRNLDDPGVYAVNQETKYAISSPATSDDATLEIAQGEKGWAKFLETNIATGSYDFVPVVETMVPDSKYREENHLRNTYGAPINPIAIGKLNVSVMVPNENTDPEHAMMSNYKWQNEIGIWYSYYNFLLNIDNLDIPDGYQLYKLRAWRKVEGFAQENDQDPLEGSILGECLSTRAPRTTTFKKAGEGLDKSYLGDWYLYEDITFGDQMYENDTEGNLMSIDFFKAYPKYLLGDRSTTIGPVFEPEQGDWTSGDNHGIQEDAIRNEKRATFGAQRLMTKTGDDKQDVGTLEKMKVSFIVRAYFTKEKESQPNNAPRRAATLNSDGKYYIAEGKADYTVLAKTNGIITGVTSISANREVSGVMYYNTMGLPSVTPWQGVNIVVTRYTDGTTSTTKVVR